MRSGTSRRRRRRRLADEVSQKYIHPGAGRIFDLWNVYQVEVLIRLKQSYDHHPAGKLSENLEVGGTDGSKKIGLINCSNLI